MSGHLVIPRFTMGISRDADGVTRRWATAVGPVDAALPGTDELFDAVLWQYGTRPDLTGGAVPAVTGVTTTLSSAAYREQVARAVAAMRVPGASLRKVVLSRPVTVELGGPLALSAVLRRLRAAEPNCTVFSMPVHDGTFFGATPELLVARHGRRVACHPLAGTVRRGDTARSDAEAQRTLTRSAKEREEHRYVVEDIASVLRPWCDELLVPEGPSLVAFSSVAHLGTRMEGTLAPDAPGVLGLLGRLHPTPAVGGTPRAEALATAARAEGESKGPWAGPVGWVDGTRRRRVDDRHPQRAPARRRPRRHPAGRLGHRGRLRSRRRGGRDRRQAGHRVEHGAPRGLSAAAVREAAGVWRRSGRPGPGRGRRPRTRGGVGQRDLDQQGRSGPGVESTSALPPSASAMARTMARPSPVPATEREGSPW